MQIRDSTTSVFCENVLRNLSLQSWVLCDLHLLLPATKGNIKLKKKITVGLEHLLESSQ